MYLVKAHRRLGAVRGCARHFGGDNVVAGSVDAFSFVVSGVLLAPAGEYKLYQLYPETLTTTCTYDPPPAGLAHSGTSCCFADTGSPPELRI